MRQSPDFPVAAAIKAAIKAVITLIKSQPPLLLLVLFAMAFILRAIFADTSYFFWDEAVYLMHGRLIAGQEVGYSETFLRPPLLPLILSPFAGLASYELVSRLLVAFLNSFIIFPVYYFTKLFFSKKAAVVAAITVAVLPVHILNSRWVMTDALGALLAFSSVTAYVLGFWQRKFWQRKKVLIYLGGLLAGLAVLMKFTNLLLLVLLLPLLIVNFRKRFSEIAVSIAAAAAVVAPYLIYSALSFGSPFYTFGRAFHVVAEQGPVSLGFFLYLLKDAFGILLAFLALGMALSLFSLFRNSNSEIVRQDSKLRYVAYCLAAALTYSFFVISTGVSKPAGIGWEAGRFLLLFVLFAIPFISYGIVQFLAFFRQLLSKFLAPAFLITAIAIIAIIVVTAAVFFSIYPQLLRAYTPAIAHEDGLRQATRDMGLYLRGNNDIRSLGCLGNCPPIAYYSGKKMGVYYSYGGLLASNSDYLVVFDKPPGTSNYGNYRLLKDFCSGGHCSHLLASPDATDVSSSKARG